MTGQAGNEKPNSAERLAFTPDDNEKLIEWARSGNHLATRPGLVLELADALEAAEKALTPTEASAEHQKHADLRRDETMTLISHGQGSTVDRIIGRNTPTAHEVTTDAQVSVEEFREHIAAERLRQAEHGYDGTHDRNHGVDHLLTWAQDYARRGKMIASVALVEAARDLLARREPSRAEVDAAIAAYKESARTHPGRAHMRAALRAAGGVR